MSLSRLQVLCHSLSKVLFKLSLTLLVRYRSSHSIFNFSRHIPATLHFTPKKCYSLSNLQCGIWVSGLNGLSPSLALYSQEGLAFSRVCFPRNRNLTSRHTIHGRSFVPQVAIAHDSASSSFPVRSPLTRGITVVFFSSAE